MLPSPVIVFTAVTSKNPYERPAAVMITSSVGDANHPNAKRVVCSTSTRAPRRQAGVGERESGVVWETSLPMALFQMGFIVFSAGWLILKLQARIRCRIFTKPRLCETPIKCLEETLDADGSEGYELRV